MSLSLIRCKQIPADASLQNFDVFGSYNYEPEWNSKEGRLSATLENDIRYVLKKYKCEILIRKGFKWDGGSVPRWQWALSEPPFGSRCDLAFLLHDALYASELFKRSRCDMIFLEMMKELGENWYRRNKIWLAVRIGGASVWKTHTPEIIKHNKKFVQLIIIHPKG